MCNSNMHNLFDSYNIYFINVDNFKYDMILRNTTKLDIAHRNYHQDTHYANKIQ